MLNIMGGLPLLKEEGLTSFKSTDRVRRLFGVKKGGYVGTLDQNATGVLLVLLGPATKLIPYLPVNDKTYIAEFQLGAKSNTLDRWGEITEQGYAHPVSKNQIQETMERFLGKIDQIPPMFSAKKVNGKRLYKHALEGKSIPRKPSSVEIKSLVLHSYDSDKGTGKFELTCTKGTYVRSLISEIGECVGCGAIMTSLIRTNDSGFSMNDCQTYSAIQQHVNNDAGMEMFVPVEKLLHHLPSVEVDPSQKTMLKNGVPVGIHGWPARSGTVKMTCEGILFGIGTLIVASGKLKPERIL